VQLVQSNLLFRVIDVIEALIKELRAAGMVLWVENGRIRGRMFSGGAIPYPLRLKAEELRDMGLAAVEALERNSDAYYLAGLPPEDALRIGEAIKRGSGLLVGKVVIHRLTGLFDITFVPLEGGDHYETH